MKNSTLLYGKVNNAISKASIRWGKSLVLLLLLSLTLGAKANPVDMRRAREVGAKFISTNTGNRATFNSDLQLVTTYHTSNNDAAFYVFNTRKGFVIVSADDCATPILGYSDEGHFDVLNIPIQMQEYLQGFVEQIQYGIDNHLVADEIIAHQWELVQTTGRITDQRATTSVAPLLNDTWGQGCYYNDLCPEDAEGPCGHVVTGCTATSFAQIMHYWGYPEVGTGSHTYTPSGYPTQTANFGATTYQWTNMPNELTSSSSAQQINAVATLMWHCGVAINMSYGPYGSGASPSLVYSSLLDYFNYSSDLSFVYKSDYTNTEWLNLMKNSLDFGRPIHYSGWNSEGSGGHSFVCDGYDSNDMLHFNWGWYGGSNDYFAVDALNPGGNDFSYYNCAIINIHPNCASGTTYQVTATASPFYGGTVYGSGTYDCGGGCALTAVPADGYMFCSWTEDGVTVSTEPYYSFTVMGNRNIVANFIEADGGSCVLEITLNDSYGDGWNGNVLTVSYSTGCNSYEELTLNNGSSATLTRNVIDGSHIILGWITGGWPEECSFTISYLDGDIIYSGSNLNDSFTYEFDVNCDGTSPTYYNITATANPPQGGTVNGTGSFTYGQTCTLTAYANTGYVFTDWTKNGVTVSSSDTYSFVVTENADFEANFEVNNPTPDNYIEIGDGGTTTSNYLPSYSFYNYTLSQQIYTADEIGTSGMITGISFFNGGTEKTRNYDLYLVTTEKSAFESSNDWIPVTDADLVFSDYVTMIAGDWTTITFNTPFQYDGVNNLAVIVDDNTGSWSSGMSCRVFDANGSQAIRVYSDDTNYDPYDPANYSGTLMSVKNQLRLVLGSNELTVYDGTTTSNYVPAYVFYFDDFTKSQYVIPANDLAPMIGSTINSVKFYTTSNNMPYTTVSTVDIYLKEVDYTEISAFEAKADCEVVYTGTMEFVTEEDGGACVITFSTPFEYNGGNLLVGCENTTDVGYKNIYFYGQTVNGASIAGSNSSSPDNVPANQRNFIPKTTFIYNGGGAPIETLHVKYMDGNVPVVDELDLGVRPVGAWMAPFEFTMYTTNSTYTVNVLDFTPSDGIFTVSGEELPFQVVCNNDIALNMVTNGTEAGVIQRQLVAITEGDRAAFVWPVTVELYTPVSPDVWELAPTVSSFPYTATLNANSIPLYDNYRLPPASIADGADAVYKLVFTEDTYLNASVTSGENGKVALYPEDFMGLGGPDLGNNYTKPQIGGSNVPFQAMIGEGTSTTGYFPFYTLYNYSIAENLFLASELAEAGVTTAPMTSLSWYATNAPGYEQQGISIWMANVNDETLTTTSHVVTDMILVYTGTMTPEVGWNEFVFNEGVFAWDGYSNILIYCQRNNGTWNSTVYWQATPSMPFNAMAYRYQDSEAYDPTIANTMYTSTTRPNIIMKSGNRAAAPIVLSSMTANPRVNNNILNRDGWMSYDDGTYATSIGNSSAMDWTWATMYPASMLGSDNTLTKVAIYNTSYNVEDITIDIYQDGTTEPGTLLATQTVTPTEGWQEVVLSSPVPLNPTQNLWIVLSENGTYVMSSCVSTVANNQWVNYEGWYNISDLASSLAGYGWMIRAYVDGNAGNNSINNLTVTPGTYYLVASSTSDEFTIEINTEEVPCPEFATNPHPADAATEVSTSVNLSWNLDSRATEYRLMFGTTYYCEDVLVDWTDTLSEHHLVYGLNNNTNYFWRIDQRNDGCPEGVLGQVWGFTTHLNVPLNLYADSFIHLGEDLTLSWDAPNDRSFLYYNIYQDYELIGSTYDTYYTVSGLPYNINPGYYFNVTAVYDEGESNFSNTRLVRVTGEGTVEGYVYEQDGITPIQGARVEFNGSGQVGGSYSYYYYTDENGYYSFNMMAGTYTGIAKHSGYQDAQYGSFTITYNELTSDINFVMDELFNPVADVVAEYYPDANDPSSPYVKVHWSFDNPLNWLYYDDGIYTTSIGVGGGVIYWASMFPATSIAPYTGKTLTKVALYENDYNTDEVTVLIYLGGDNVPQTLVSTMNYTPVGGDAFHEVSLTSPVVIDGTQNLWIVFSEYGTYPANACTDAGEVNNRWVSLDGEEWMDVASAGVPGYGWMIRGFVSNGSSRGETMISNNLINPNQQPSDVVLSPRNGSNNGVFLTASNVTPHNVGTPGAIDIEEFNRSFQYYRVYRTNDYNNGPYTTDNTVLLADNVTDTLLIDITWPDVEMGSYKYGVSCVYAGNRESQITWGETNQQQSSAIMLEGNNRDVILSEDFDDGLPEDWSTIDGGSPSGYGWQLASVKMGSTGYGHNGSDDSMISESYDNSYGALNPDNYLITPQVPLGGVFSFWACAQDASYAAEHFGLAVSTSGNTDPNDFTMVQEWTMTAKAGNRFIKGEGMRNDDRGDFRSQGNWYYYEVNLSEYAGLDGYIAIRHFNCTDQFYLNIDDVEYFSTLQLSRESQITWSNPMYKDMILNEGEVNITVALNSGDNPEGTTVSFINLNSAEQQLYPVADVVLDGTGYYAWDSFRKGDYQVTITKEGYETIIDNVSIWDPTSLSYMMTEIIYGVIDLYVSRTGWAKWYGHGEPSTPGPGPGGFGDSFSVDFESGMPADWTTIDADGDGYNWMLASTAMGTGYGHNGSSDMIMSQSYNNNVGALTPDNYLVSPQVTLGAGSTFSFWACAQDNAWASEHFGVAVSDNGTSDWTMVQEWTMTAKGEGGKVGHSRNGGNRAQGNWYQYTVDLSAFAGQKYIAIRHFNCTDWFYLDVDDITLTNGAKPGDRHLEYYQVICESINHEPIFSINTPHNFCQLATDGLVEGEHYLCQVAAVYSTGMSAWTEPVEWEYEPCDHWGPVDDVVVYANDQGNRIEWIFENGYNPYGGNKSSLEFDSQPSNVMGDDTDYPMLSKGGEFYSQYAEDGLMLNFFALDNVDLRAYLLYNLSNDSRFTLVPEEEYGQFILTSNDANNNFMDAFETAYQNAMVDFSLMSKVDIDDHLVTWKSSVAPTDYLSIMMDVITAKTRNENDHCINSIPFCTSDVVTFNAASTSQTADQLEGTTIEDGCILASYNPSWYHMRIHTAGQFVIHMEGHDPVDPTILRDIDYCVWGPFTNPYLPCTSDLTTDKIIDCNFSAHYSEDVFMGYPEGEHQHQAGHGTVNYHMPEIGEYYIMMITNYSRQPCNITFTKTEGVGETDCDIIYTTGIIGFLITEDDEYVAIASPDDRDYTVEGEFGEHEYCVRPIYPGEMQLPAQNYGWSMGCPQIASNDEENHWNVDIHEYPYNMSVTGIIQINGVEQQTPTLEIGAFCGDECRGAQRLTYYPQVDCYLVFLTLYGDAGDVMSFRLYDHVAGQELDIACSSTISFVPDGFIGTPFDPYVFDFGNMTVEQVSNFSQGYNWWSTCIEQEGINGLGILQEGLGSNGVTIRSQASGYTDYYQGYGWYGSLSSLNNESSYRVITSAPCTVTMTGSTAVPSQHPITLSQGWTWIGYVPSTAMSVDAAMANVNATSGDKLKSQQGYADYYAGYGWFGSLNTIELGMGLMYYSANSATTTFTYPDSNRGGELKANLTSENNHWVPNIYAYPDNMTVMAVVELDDMELTSDNYELAAFAANGECRGSVKLAFAEPLNRHVAFLTIAGEDAAELSFRLYDTETNVEYYDAEESLDFVADAIVGEATDLYTIHFRGAAVMDEFANMVRVYPNPVNRGERVSIGMKAESKSPVRVEIVNALGAVVSEETSTQAPASIVAPVTAGVYTLRITVEGKGTAVRKLVVK